MLKLVRPTSSASVVWPKDPAIDLSSDDRGKCKSDLEKYEQEVARNPTCWKEYLTFKDGERPTEFVIGMVDPSELNRIEDECGLGTSNFKAAEMRWLCFLYGVRNIQNLELEGKKGVPQIQRFDMEYVDPKWLAQTFSGPLRSCALFIGGVIWRWNNLNEEDSKN